MYINWNWLPPDCCGNCNAIFLLKMGPKCTTLFIYSLCSPLSFTVTFIFSSRSFVLCITFMKFIKITPRNAPLSETDPPPQKTVKNDPPLPEKWLPPNLTIYFQDGRSAASLRCRNCAKIIVFICDQRPNPIWSSSRRQSYPVYS